MDWATQPDPFRRYPGAHVIPLPHEEADEDDRGVDRRVAAPLHRDSIGWFLRYSMGLSAWKAYRDIRWALRVNPSSGNLHPTEAYLVHDGRVSHYAPHEHAVEERAILPYPVWEQFLRGRPAFLVGLTSIQWREAWKYGERAFRYCQHDVGHAIAALRISASLFGWTLRLLPEWSDEQLATLLGVDRKDDRGDAEPEHPECLALVGSSVSWMTGDPASLVGEARSASWQGRANVLSSSHDEWPIIERVTEATAYAGRLSTPNSSAFALRLHARFGETSPKLVAQNQGATSGGGQLPSLQPPNHEPTRPESPIPDPEPLYSRDVILRRRSALAFDARSVLPREKFVAMLEKLEPTVAPFDALDWPPHVHLALFVHRVDGLVPGVYAFLRDASVIDEWRLAMRPEFIWEQVSNRLFLLLPTDVTWAANRLSCDQEIASAGFFSLGMIARLESALRDRGEWFYRRLFWECGMIGQVLYLEAEAAGVRGTGIGCFYDDAVHELLGLSSREWQSLYHFSMGMPVDDARLTTDPGYAWDVSANANQDLPAHGGAGTGV